MGTYLQPQGAEGIAKRTPDPLKAKKKPHHRAIQPGPREADVLIL